LKPTDSPGKPPAGPAAPPVAGSLHGKHYALCLLFFLLALVAYVHRLIINVLIEPLSADLALTDSLSSLLQGMPFAVLYGLAVIPLGLLADRFNRMHLLSASVLLWCLGMAAAGFAPGFRTLFAASMLVGLGQAALLPCVVSLVGDSFPADRRGIAMGVFLTGVTAGYSVAYAAGGLLLDAASGGAFANLPWIGGAEPWRQAFVIAAFPGLLLLIPLSLQPEPPREERVLSEGLLRPLQDLFKTRPFAPLFVLVLVHVALLAMADFGLYSWIPRLLSRAYSLAASDFGFTVGLVVAAGGVAGGLLGGWVTDLAIERWRAAGAALIMLLGVLLAAFSGALFAVESLAVSYLALCLWNIAITANSTATYSYIAIAAHHNCQGIASSLVIAVNVFVGLGSGPLAIALALEHLLQSPDRVGAAMAAVSLPLALVAALAVGRVWRRESGSGRAGTTMHDRG
jgi:MFS family permease